MIHLVYVLPGDSLDVYYVLACVMNVITHDAAYSLYPYATFELNTSLVLTRDLEERTQRALHKYEDRGFRLVDPSPTDDEDDEDEDDEDDEDDETEAASSSDPDLAGFFVDGTWQRVADRHSWRLPLNVDGLPPATQWGSVEDEKKRLLRIRWWILPDYGTYRVAYGGGSRI